MGYAALNYSLFLDITLALIWKKFKKIKIFSGDKWSLG
jgi:hypothetical protein